jgi:IS4 transposase
LESRRTKLSLVYHWYITGISLVYHWYITNLKVGAYIIYPLYRIRWQIELIFKGCKNSLNASQITSNDKNIIESLLLSSLAAQLASNTIFNIAGQYLGQDQKLATSFQRVLKVCVDLSSEFIRFLLGGDEDRYYKRPFSSDDNVSSWR